MPYKQIDDVLAPADAQAVKDALATIQQKLPFLGTLTEEERKQLSKAGPEHAGEIPLGGQVAVNNPDILPATFDQQKYQNVVSLFSTITDLSTSAQQLARSLDDTRIMVGVYAKQQTSKVHQYAKAAIKDKPGLKPVVDQLGALGQKAADARRAKKNSGGTGPSNPAK